MQSVFNDLGDIFSHHYVALILVTALAFDFLNGFHDAANSIATIVGTRVLKPVQAVCWAAFWNFMAAWIFGLAVANTVAKWVNPEFVTPDVLFAGLLGAIAWNIITWYYGLPSSSSHALLGGFCGAALMWARHYAGVLHTGKVLKTIYFIPLSPLIGLVLGFAIIVVLLWVFRNAVPSRVNGLFRWVQLCSSAAYSLGHGSNDAQKTMGVIAALLYATIWRDQQGEFTSGHVQMPMWIVVVCYLTIGMGTMAGGWRIVKTLGLKLTKLRPFEGACAETAAAASLFLAAHYGIPVSTTHTITGGIVGVGGVQRFSAVRWGIARRVVWAWILTIPASAIMGAAALAAITFLRSLR
jgi:inorganic phosphate transporter, PiT family